MSELDNLMNFADVLSDNENIKPLTDLIEQIMSLPDDQLNDTTVDIIIGALNGMLTPAMKKESVQAIVDGYENQNLTRVEAKVTIDTMKGSMKELINELKPSANKMTLLNAVFDSLYEMFDEALEHYHNYSIELPIQLEEGAQMPTYAHDGDVAADLYAADTVVVAAHSISNMIRTGVHIGLPEGWAAYIVPRSSIGAKTPLRLSNSVGVIDSGYRGPLGVLYDNISDSDYTINAGDRIAQLIIMPAYRFKGHVVDALDDTDRGQGGFGSSGK